MHIQLPCDELLTEKRRNVPRPGSFMKRERPTPTPEKDVRYGLDIGTRTTRRKAGNEAALALIRGMRETKPAVCEWLSKETYVQPAVVNIVYMMSLKSQSIRGPLPLVRMAQYMPNTKARHGTRFLCS